MIVGHKTQTIVSPTPEKGPMREVFRDWTASLAAMPSRSSVAVVAPKIIEAMQVVALK